MIYKKLCNNKNVALRDFFNLALMARKHSEGSQKNFSFEDHCESFWQQFVLCSVFCTMSLKSRRALLLTNRCAMTKDTQWLIFAYKTTPYSWQVSFQVLSEHVLLLSLILYVVSVYLEVYLKISRTKGSSVPWAVSLLDFKLSVKIATTKSKKMSV